MAADTTMKMKSKAWRSGHGGAGLFPLLWMHCLPDDIEASRGGNEARSMAMSRKYRKGAVL